jgi:CelD/BcsL family acetyltransferase involved in cellulose biosynthesis
MEIRFSTQPKCLGPAPRVADKQPASELQSGFSSIRVSAARGGVEMIDDLAEQWRELCRESSNDEPFFRPEWIGAYMRAFAADETVVLLTARSEGRLLAVLPLLEEQTSFLGLPVIKLRGAANIHSGRFDLVHCAGSEGDRAAHAVWDYLKNTLDWDVIEFPQVPEGGGIDGWIAAAKEDGFYTGKVHSFEMPYVQLVPWEGGWDWWLCRLSGNFRHNLRRRVRKLPSEPKLRRVERADPEALQLFYEIERSGWKGADGGAIACNPQTLKFYDEIARMADRFGYLTLYFLEVGGKTIAAQFGLTYNGRYFVPKCAYDESAQNFSPGHLLVNSILRDCSNRGLTEFDFLGPWMEWKANWTPLSRPHNTFLIFRDTVSGSAIHAAKFGWKRLAKKLFDSELVRRAKDLKTSFKQAFLHVCNSR